LLFTAESQDEEVRLMVTFPDLFQFVTMLCAVITVALLFIRKK